MANKKIITLEVAKKEVEQWMESKKIPPSKRRSNQDQADAMADAIVDGYLILNKENFTFEHTLQIPIKNAEGEETVKTLVYKSRLNSIDMDIYLKGVKLDDGFALIRAYIRALTGQSSQVIKTLDSSSDLSLARSIATFFL